MTSNSGNDDEDYNWITEHMFDRRHDYHIVSSYGICIRSWNVKASFCDNDSDLYQWIFHNTSSSSSIDIIAIGLQEIINLNNPFSSALDVLSSSQTLYWKEKLLHVINSNTTTSSKYISLNTINCVGMCLLLFVKEDICHRISDIRNTTTPTGFLGIFGNKGAVSISIVIDDTPICFVNAHLTSGREHIKKRNDDYHKIISSTTFHCNDVDRKNYGNDDVNPIIASTNLVLTSALNIISMPFTAINDSTNSNSYYNRRPALRWHLSYHCQSSLTRSILDHEIVFFLGDLNYHIDSSISTEEVFGLVDSKSLEKLQQNDQLILSKNIINTDDSNDSTNTNDPNNIINSFTGFQEGLLSFPPTFKYKTHHHEYERKQQPVRAPAWCDRILWKVNPYDNTINSNTDSIVELQSYDSVNILGSDHRPIIANFKCPRIRGIDSTLERSIFNGLQYTRHAHDVKNIPKIEIDRTVIDLGKLKRSNSNIETIKITNTGNVKATVTTNIRNINRDSSNSINDDPLNDISSYGIICPNPRRRAIDNNTDSNINWFSLSVATVCIEVGESILLEVRSDIDYNTSRKLVDSNDRINSSNDSSTTTTNDGSSSTKEIQCSSLLLLMVDGGSHHYITVHGLYRYRTRSNDANKAINDNDNNDNVDNDDDDEISIKDINNNSSSKTTEFYCGPWLI